MLFISSDSICHHWHLPSFLKHHWFRLISQFVCIKSPFWLNSFLAEKQSFLTSAALPKYLCFSRYNKAQRNNSDLPAGIADSSCRVCPLWVLQQQLFPFSSLSLWLTSALTLHKYRLTSSLYNKKSWVRFSWSIFFILPTTLLDAHHIFLVKFCGSLCIKSTYNDFPRTASPSMAS